MYGIGGIWNQTRATLHAASTIHEDSSDNAVRNLRLWNHLSSSRALRIRLSGQIYLLVNDGAVNLVRDASCRLVER